MEAHPATLAEAGRPVGAVSAEQISDLRPSFRRKLATAGHFTANCIEMESGSVELYEEKTAFARLRLALRLGLSALA